MEPLPRNPEYGCPTGGVPRKEVKMVIRKFEPFEPVSSLGELLNEKLNPSLNPLDIQVSGSHYKSLKIQPVEYIHANDIPFIEGSIIKYATRWRAKGGVKDLEKIKHFVDLLISLETLK